MSTRIIFTSVVLFLVNYLPGVGMYIIIPTAMAAHVRVSAVIVWGILGNIAPAVTVVLFYDRLMEHPRLSKWLNRLSSKRLQFWGEKYGWWFVFFISPWTGTWVTGVTAKILRMDNRRFLIVTALSLVLFAVTEVALIYAGVKIFPTPQWLQDLL